jgi:hypothetical protein
VRRYNALAGVDVGGLRNVNERNFSDWEDPEPGELPTEPPPEA